MVVLFQQVDLLFINVFEVYYIMFKSEYYSEYRIIYVFYLHSVLKNNGNGKYVFVIFIKI